MEDNREYIGYWTPVELENYKGMKLTHKFIMIQAHNMSRKTGWAHFTNGFMAEKLGLSAKRVGNLICFLVDKGYLFREQTYKPGTRQVDTRYLRPTQKYFDIINSKEENTPIPPPSRKRDTYLDTPETPSHFRADPPLENETPISKTGRIKVNTKDKGIKDIVVVKENENFESTTTTNLGEDLGREICKGAELSSNPPYPEYGANKLEECRRIAQAELSTPIGYRHIPDIEKVQQGPNTGLSVYEPYLDTKTGKVRDPHKVKNLLARKVWESMTSRNYQFKQAGFHPSWWANPDKDPKKDYLQPYFIKWAGLYLDHKVKESERLGMKVNLIDHLRLTSMTVIAQRFEAVFFKNAKQHHPELFELKTIKR